MREAFERYEKKLYRFFVVPFVNQKHIRLPAAFESIVSADPAKLFVIVVAFNDMDLVALHRRAVAKFLKDPYEYFVADNSNDDAGSARIKEYCLGNRINYLRLPKIAGWRGPSQQTGWGGISHGFALNWAYRNIVEKYKPARFGFWDYDLFPVHPITIGEFLSRGSAWGIAIKNRPVLRPWNYPFYLWPGLAFFRRERFKGSMPNFVPEFGVDTGGAVSLDAGVVAANPGIPDFYEAPLVEIAPGVKVWQYKDFVHFGGSSNGPTDALAIKKRWMDQLLQSS